MASLKKHSKQWFIGSSAILEEPIDVNNFVKIQLINGLSLYHDCDLDVYRYSDNKEILVLGIALGDHRSPERLFQSAGRFVVIEDGILTLDATGSMGVFYYEKPGTILCTSSQSLLADLFGEDLQGRDLKGARMNWDPVPLARINGMKRLMIGQALDLNRNEVVSVSQQITGDLTFEQAKIQLSDELIQTADKLKSIKQPIYLAMTGGLDSRTVFAALIRAGVKFKAFTLILNDARSKVDAKLAAKLCQRFGIQHLKLKRNRPNKRNSEIYKAHSGGFGGDRGITYALGDYYRSIPDHAVVLHGGCFEIGRRYYDPSFRSVRTDDSQKLLTDLSSQFNISTKPETEALRSWIKYRMNNPIPGVDWVDLFYLDQRRGGWGAANRQEEDVFNFDWLIFANSWRIIDIMLSAPQEDRKDENVQIGALEMLIPSITEDVPLNPELGRIAYLKKALSNRDLPKLLIKKLRDKLKR